METIRFTTKIDDEIKDIEVDVSDIVEFGIKNHKELLCQNWRI